VKYEFLKGSLTGSNKQVADVVSFSACSWNTIALQTEEDKIVEEEAHEG